MSFLDQLKAKKNTLKSTVINITQADGSQERILLLKSGVELRDPHQVQPSTKSYGFIVDTKPDFEAACILEDFLYLGSQDAVSHENVQKLMLTDILSIGIETPASDIDSNTIRNHYIECLDLPETCLEMVLSKTNRIISDIRSRNGRVLVHCNAGVSRSSTVCIAYLMYEQKMDFNTAYRRVKSKRECIRPNDGFLKQLKQIGLSG